MSQFKRENRYIVIKRMDVERVPPVLARELWLTLNSLYSHITQRQYLVIESDWPEYEPAWQMIQNRMEGNAPQTQSEIERLKNELKIAEELLKGCLEANIQGWHAVRIESFLEHLAKQDQLPKEEG
jgi:hypothetical protein